MMKINGIGIENNFSYDVRFEYETNLEKFLELYFRQNFNADLLGNTFNKRTVGVNFTKRLVENLEASAGLSFSNYNDGYIAAGGDTMILEFNPALSFDLGRDFFFEVGYNGYYNKWGSASEDVVNNRFFVTLRYEKGSSRED